VVGEGLHAEAIDARARAGVEALHARDAELVYVVAPRGLFVTRLAQRGHARLEAELRDLFRALAQARPSLGGREVRALGFEHRVRQNRALGAAQEPLDLLTDFGRDSRHGFHRSGAGLARVPMPRCPS
jgi:hypothetical protein